MWDFLSKVAVHLIDKVSFAMLALFFVLFGVYWFFLPYDMWAYYIAHRVLPIWLYYAVLCGLTGLSIVVLKAIVSSYQVCLKKCRSQQEILRITAYLKQLSDAEGDIINQIWDNHLSPTRVNTTDPDALNQLELNGIIRNVGKMRVSPIYILTQPAIRALTGKVLR